MKTIGIFLIVAIMGSALNGSTTFAQIDKNSDLFQEMKAKDSLLFEISFNQCRLEAIEDIIANDLEFYHDQSGITESKSEFMSVMKNGICRKDNPTKSRRELIANTLTIYPLYNNGELYGALQNGEHRFFESYNGATETPGSVASFSHLWLKKNNNWILKRVISYNHKNQ